MTGLSDTHTRPLWRDRRFATYWSGQTVSQLGDRISELALPLIAVTTLHASAAEVGVLTAAIWAPNLLSLVVGAWVDHQRRKKRLLVVANLIQAAAVAVLPVAHLAGFMSMWLLYAVALVLGAGGVLYQTSYPPFFARLVRRDQYLQANSLLSATRSASFIAGPALGGLLIQASPHRWRWSSTRCRSSDRPWPSARSRSTNRRSRGPERARGSGGGRSRA